MSLDLKRARWFGVLYLITFVTSIPALALYETVLRHPVSYIAGAGHDKQVLLGALLELLLIIANIGTVVVIFPILRRLSEELALDGAANREHLHPRRHRLHARHHHVTETRLQVRLRGRSRARSR